MPVVVPPSPGPSDRSANMRANRRRDTTPELRIRRWLHANGARYRVDFPVRDGRLRPVKPDIAFTRHRVAVFVDGCFWHGCPEHGRRSGGRNDEYWSAKIARNAERDAEQTARLSDHGWRVVRFWEHEPAEEVAQEILAILNESA